MGKFTVYQVLLAHMSRRNSKGEGRSDLTGWPLQRGVQEWPFPAPVVRRGRKMATGFGQREDRDSRMQDLQERIKLNGGLPGLRRSAQWNTRPERATEVVFKTANRPVVMRKAPSVVP
jgi:hypothetical protein